MRRLLRRRGLRPGATGPRRLRAARPDHLLHRRPGQRGLRAAAAARRHRLGRRRQGPHRDPGRLRQGRGDRLGAAGRVRRLRGGARPRAAADRGPRLRRRRRRRDHDQDVGPPPARCAVGSLHGRGRPLPRRSRPRPATTRASTSRPAGPVAARGSGSATRSTSAPGQSPTPRSGSSSSTPAPRGRGRRRSRSRRPKLSAPERLLDPGGRRRDRRRDAPPGRSPPMPWWRAGGSPSPASAEPCRYLPADWLYETPLPKTKFVAPFPNARFSGSLDVDGTTIELSEWPGMIGHNWGSEHAERWVWLEGTGFAGEPETYFDAGAARIRLGPWTTPLDPLRDAGSRRQSPTGSAGIDQIRSSRISERPTSCDFRLSGRDAMVEGRVIGTGQGLRRLGLRRSRGARAQHPELLDLRPRAERQPQGPARSPPAPLRRRCL